MQALSSWGATLYGFVAILAITPLAALLALRLPLQPELAVGLAVFSCMPTTLSSGVTLTQVQKSDGCAAVCRCATQAELALHIYACLGMLLVDGCNLNRPAACSAGPNTDRTWKRKNECVC